MFNISISSIKSKECSGYLAIAFNKFSKYSDGIWSNSYSPTITAWSKRLEGRHYDVIQFRNGYAKVAPVMIVAHKGMGVDDGRYAIQLGKILESKNVT